jgi:ATP-dependent Zn protease
VVSSDDSVSGPMSLEVRSAVNRILNEQMEEALRLIRENREKLDALVDALMLRNHLTGAEIEEILNPNKD